MLCPYCNHDNIDGIDLCHECGQPLTDMEEENSTQLEQTIIRRRVSKVCDKEPFSISPTLTVREAIDLMCQKKIGCLVVCEGDALVGIFTERDVLNRVSSDLNRMDQPVSKFMTAAPETVTKHESIAYTLHAMNLGGYRHMPVVNAERHPVGIISIRDILRFICGRFAELGA